MIGDWRFSIVDWRGRRRRSHAGTSTPFEITDSDRPRERKLAARCCGSGCFNYQITRLPNHQISGFTLVEMVVVIAIIILLVGLVVPAATQMWRDRKIADAQNIITGMMMTARARAIQSGGVETGLFFFVDDQGVQRVVPISQDPNAGQTDAAKMIHGWETDTRWNRVFTATRGQSFTMPAPMRVVPLYTICPESNGTGMCELRNEKFEVFETQNRDELGNNKFAGVAIGSDADVAQAHRNYFTLIFSPNGEMMVDKDVLIRDIDDEAAVKTAPSEEGVGVVTLQKVSAPASGVKEFHQNGANNPKTSLVMPGTAQRKENDKLVDAPPQWLIVDSTGVAMNFPSVDGLLVYDDSLFNDLPDAESKRGLLKERGLPFYINRITGAVVRGPAGEGPTQ